MILSSPEDVHYRAVDWALRRIGLRTALHYGNCFPQDETQTVLFESNHTTYYGKERNGATVDLLSAPVIWYRRGHWPILNENLSDADKFAAKREAEMFLGGARSIAATSQRWINDPDREFVANRKPYQLDIAQRMGLVIPRTIMSNDPLEIKAFFANTTGDVILKPFHAMQWLQDQTHYVQFAKKLKFEDIEDSEDLRLTGHIFQEYVEKLYELRVFYFGGKILSFKLNTQDFSKTKTDWRISTDGSLRPEYYNYLPEKTQIAITKYMIHMGLEFGAFDFIVNAVGDYVFLECNVSGQFLFIEEWNPNIQLLSEFVRFLTSNINLTQDQQQEIDRLHYLDFYHSRETGAYYNAISDLYGRPFVSRNLHQEQAQT